jgi:Uma2 family endonuclease
MAFARLERVLKPHKSVDGWKTALVRRADYNNDGMSTRAADLLDPIMRLLEGASLVFQDVSWDDYEQVLHDLGDHRRFRVAYDCGRLEIVSPRIDHDNPIRFIDRLLQVVSDELDLTIEAYGRTTWKRKALRKGVEPDNCFYIENAARVIGKGNFDLESYPPPDIVVEIDITNRSLNKFSIYAALQIPEVWLCEGGAVRFFALSENSYVETPVSRSLPILKPGMLAAALDLNQQIGQTAALRTFRHELQTLIQK